MTTYWLSTKSPSGIFRAAYQTKERDTFLRETVGVDSAILAQEMGLGRNRVEAYQRKLGLRKITGNVPKVPL